MARTDTPRPVEALQVILLGLLSNPPIPKEPANRGCDAAPGDHSHGAHTLLVDAHEADDKYDDGTDVLHNDSRVCN